MLEIRPTLLRKPLIACLILGRDQSVGTATLLGLEIEVAPILSDAHLDMAAPVLSGFQLPLRLVGVDEEGAQADAIGASAFERIGPRPVFRRRQWQRDAMAQMVEARFVEHLDGRPSGGFLPAGKGESGRN